MKQYYRLVDLNLAVVVKILNRLFLFIRNKEKKFKYINKNNNNNNYNYKTQNLISSSLFEFLSSDY
jgi:hypothetical protein